ncbi:MAG: histidine--tRNA ligase [Candidatus Krumholzibacteriia bacterium]
MKYARPRGTQDILPPDVYVWRYVEGVFDETFQRFGYDPVRTPIFESTDLFLRSVGEGTDIVSKEMYTFTDRGGRSVTLRPENTASVIRAYLESGMHRRGGITRLSYTGPMFRYDRPQAGRYRQFHQVGVEAIGSLNPALDVEVIDVVMSGLERLGFTDLSVKVNSVGCRVCRGAYADVLREALDAVSGELCDDCTERSRRNPMRVFDCKTCTGVAERLPRIPDHLCQECDAHFEQVRSLLRTVDRTYEHDPTLVRGLDYYTKTAFEIVHGSLGAQNALCGGGRYDDLIQQCGGPDTPAVGFSAGLERIISVLPASAAAENTPVARADVYVACADDASAGRALRTATTLRCYGRVEVDVSMRSLKKQLKNAEKSGAGVTVIVERDTPEAVKWKDMAARTQVDVPEGELAAHAERHLDGGKRR